MAPAAIQSVNRVTPGEGSGTRQNVDWDNILLYSASLLTENEVTISERWRGNTLDKSSWLGKLSRYFLGDSSVEICWNFILEIGRAHV